MCKDKDQNDFAAFLEEAGKDFDKELNNTFDKMQRIDPETNADTLGQTRSQATVARYEQNCPSCKGCGSFYSYTGRLVGPCFKCEGKGVIHTKTDPQVLAKERTRRAEKKVEAARSAKEQAEAFLEEEPEIAEWFADNASWMDFARSLLDQLNRKGSLSEKQVAAARRSAAKMAAKKQAKAVERSAADSELDISSLKGYYAVPNGETRLKVRVAHPGRNSSWHGTIFVSDGAEYGQRINYGRQAPGKKYNGKIQKELTAILADPNAAQAAYGQLTGTCGACGRQLEDETSIELGIGPICRGKLGI